MPRDEVVTFRGHIQSRVNERTQLFLPGGLFVRPRHVVRLASVILLVLP